MRRIFDPPASHTPSRVTIVVTALIALVVVSGLIYFAAVAPRGVPGYDYYVLNAQFDDASDVRLLSTVAVAGRRAGQVGRTQVRNGRALLKLQLKPGERYLLSDTTARIRMKNPVGAKYVDLTPGTRGTPLRDGATIPVRQTSTAVDYSELLSTFDRATRRNLAGTLKGLGGGFLARGPDLNDALQRGPELFSDTAALSRAVLARTGAAERFVPSAEALASAYDPVREQLATGFDPEARALAPFGDRRLSVERTLREAPPALSSLRRGLDASTPLLRETAGWARETRELTGPAPSALAATSRLLRDGGPALSAARPLLRATGDAVSPTLGFLGDLDPVVAPTERWLQSQLRPLREFGSRPCDVFNWASDWRDALSWGVPTGTDPLSDLDYSQGIGPLNSFRVMAVPPVDQQSLLPDAQVIPGQRIGRNPYPAPCQAAKDVLK